MKSANSLVSNGARLYASDGSFVPAETAGGWTTMRPEIGNGCGLLICIDVLNCDPYAPACDATAGMIAVGGAAGILPAAFTRVMSPGKMCTMKISPLR